MEYTLPMEYDHKAMKIMARAIRLALQEEQDKKSKLIGWFFAIAGALIVAGSQNFGYKQIIACIVLVLLTIYLLIPDDVHGLWASIKMPSNMKKGTWTFCEDGFYSTTESGISGFDYESVFAIIECQGYLVVCFANSQGQVFNMNAMTKGTPGELRKLLRKKTNLTIQEV